MKTVTTTVYEFQELSEEAQENAIENFLSTNINHEWWEFIYADALCIGVKIKAFDLDRSSYVDAELVGTGKDTAEAIIKNHGEKCSTYENAKKYLADLSRLDKKYPLEYDDYEYENELKELDKNFLHELCDDYQTALQKEYDYLTSEEQIIESIKLNSYHFTIDGKVFTLK